MRWILRIAGIVLIAFGAIPFTPLIWLLVLVPGEAPWFLAGVRLQFWQTQTIGAAVALCGLLLIAASYRAMFRKGNGKA